MSSLAVFLYLLAAVLLALAVSSLLRSRKADIYVEVRRRFRELAVPVQVEKDALGSQWQLVELVRDSLLRAGIEPTPRLYWLAGATLLFSLLIGAAEAGWRGALILPVVLAASAAIYLRIRYKRRVSAMLRQLPGFVDFLVRGVSIGQTLAASVRDGTEKTQQPLREVLERVRFNADLGGDLGEAFRNAGRLHRLRELDLLALAVSVNERYGGSVRDLLRSIIRMLEQRERAQRDLRAMTGETRLSAWVLGLLPTGIGLYMVMMNPSYIGTMWNDPAGRLMLYYAVGAQIVGGVILWRMMKSI